MPNAVKNVKFTNDYDVEAADIERQRRMAEALQQQGMAGGRPTEMVGGWAIPQSPLEGVGRVAQQVAGKYQQDQLTERQKALAEAMRTKNSEDTQQFMTALNGTPERPEIPPGADDLGGGPGRPMEAAVPGDPGKAMGFAMGSQAPILQNAAGAMLAEKLKPPKTTYQDGGNVIYVMQGEKIVGTIPKGNTPDAVLKDTTTRSKVELAPSGVAFNPYLTKPDTVFNDPNKIMNLDAFGRPVVNNPYVDAQKDIKAAGKPVTNVNVTNAGPQAFEKELGKLDAEQLGKWRTNAEAGQSALNTVNNLRGAIQQGVFSGGGAQAKAAAANIVNGLTGSTPKNLPGSELFNAEASKLLLDSIKALGSNPSNADRLFLEKTLPNIGTSPQARDQLLDYMEGKAKAGIDLYRRADTHARANRGLSGFDAIQPIPTPGKPSVSPLTQQYLDRVKNGQ